MRVLQVMASGERGGGADHLFGIVPALVEHGIFSDVAVGLNGPTLKTLHSMDITAIPIDMMSSRLNVGAILRLADLLKRNRPDIVHYHGTRAALFGALCPSSVPSVYTAHGLSYRKEASLSVRVPFLAAEGVICRRMSAVVSVSQRDIEDLQRRGLLRGAGVHLPNAVDSQRFRPAKNFASAREHLAKICNTDFQGKMVVGTASRLVPQKSVVDMVEAAAKADVHLVVIGDGPLRDEVEQAITRSGASVTLLGSRQDVPELLPGLDVFCLSSRWEGEPIALLEALACGLPCVATRTDGAREILEDVDAGRLVGIGAVDEIAAAFSEMQSTPLRKRLGKAGRAAMLERTYQRSAEKLARVYRRLVAQHSPVLGHPK